MVILVSRTMFWGSRNQMAFTFMVGLTVCLSICLPVCSLKMCLPLFNFAREKISECYNLDLFNTFFLYINKCSTVVFNQYRKCCTLNLIFRKCTLKWSRWISHSYCSLKSLWFGHGGSRAGFCLAAPTSLIPFHCALIISRFKVFQ